MTWESIDLRGAARSQEREDDLQRYIGCTVQLLRNGVSEHANTRIHGTVKALNTDFITFAGLKPVLLLSGDVLQYDLSGPRPMPFFTDEEKELGEVLYNDRRSRMGGPDWVDVSVTGKREWSELARTALKWRRSCR